MSPLRSFSLRILIRLSDFIELGICHLRPEPIPTPTPKENDSLNYIQHLNDCLAISED